MTEDRVKLLERIQDEVRNMEDDLKAYEESILENAKVLALAFVKGGDVKDKEDCLAKLIYIECYSIVRNSFIRKFYDKGLL